MHLSYSSWKTLRMCGEKFRLQKLKAPEVPSYSSSGGRAFHAATEDWERDKDRVDITERWTYHWTTELAKARAIEPDESLWYTAGRKTEKTPNKEDGDFWVDAGRQWCLDYVEATAKQNWALWELPDGKPAIEVGLIVTLGGIVMRQYVDRLYVTGDGELVVVDLKSGSRTPGDAAQLGVYACGVERAFGIRPTYGFYYMARKSSFGLPILLDNYTSEVLGEQFAIAARIWEQGLFLPNPDQHCRFCGVRRFCRAEGGLDWRDYAGMIPEAA